MVSQFIFCLVRRPLLLRVAPQLPSCRDFALRGSLLRWTAPLTLTASAIVLASCLGSGDGLTSSRITVVPSQQTMREPSAPASVTQNPAVRSPTSLCHPCQPPRMKANNLHVNALPVRPRSRCARIRRNPGVLARPTWPRREEHEDTAAALHYVARRVLLCVET